MTEAIRSGQRETRLALSKVPAVTVWFWIIKILCTTVGESFADWINVTMGVGLHRTALTFTVVLAAVMAWQLRLNRYVPLVYWLCVVVFSVTGTLYTDILTDDLHIPLAVSTSAFAVALAVVFGVWFRRERTLSIHSIVTLRRELFYWLAVLVTFALGTAAGDWTLQLTGWGPGISVLLPAGLIAAIVIGWRMGANAVLSFWLAYILTRPLGANLGDWLASPRAAHGLGLGTAATSAIFLIAILATVGYLTGTRSDVMEQHGRGRTSVAPTNPARERIMLGYYVVVAAAAVALVFFSAALPHSVAAGEEEAGAPAPPVAVAPGQLTAHFPPAETAKFRAIVQATLERVRAGDLSGAKARITDLERGWDDDESSLRPMDPTAWKAIDGQIDAALKAVRARHPDPTAETQSLNALLTALG
ncbi:MULTISPECIES: hypothetical protein [unclassified Mycobacterium]|uniref:COG4705 family protein n=1 Tax=unclassified Mycobacterium TaxID=2642494 RepID=UPI0006DC7DD5|nr:MULTISPECIES: hypothetical protein [unclassified Mycobacterium]